LENPDNTRTENSPSAEARLNARLERIRGKTMAEVAQDHENEMAALRAAGELKPELEQ